MLEQHAPVPGNGRPVIIPNGFLPCPCPLFQVVRIYNQQGYRAEAVTYEVRNMRDVLIYADTILGLARQAHEQTGQRAIIIGLSMGGVATLHALKFMSAAQHIKTLVAVGSPFRGSPIAPFGVCHPKFWKTAKQLSPGSNYLLYLRRMPFPAGVRFVSLAGLRDLVSPISTTNLSEAENYIWDFWHHDLILPWLHHEIIKLLP